MSEPHYVDRGDLVSILLQDENFKNDKTRIIDEAVTFFLAGSQTTSTMLSNTLLFSLMEPSTFSKIRAEIKDVLITP